jgi:hypothetical protein
MLVGADEFCAFNRNSYVRNVVGGPANAAASRSGLWRWSALNPVIVGRQRCETRRQRHPVHHPSPGFVHTAS